MSVCRTRFEIFGKRRDQIEDQRSRPGEAAYDKLMLSEGFIKLRKATFDDHLGKFEFSYRDRSHYSVSRLLRILCRSEAEFGEPLTNPSELKPAPQLPLITSPPATSLPPIPPRVPLSS